jgi:hypothetical protein
MRLSQLRFTVRTMMVAMAFVGLMLGLIIWTLRDQRRVDSEFYADLEQSLLRLAEKAERSAKSNPKDSARTSRQVAALCKEAAKFGEISRRSRLPDGHQ